MYEDQLSPKELTELADEFIEEVKVFLIGKGKYTSNKNYAYIRQWFKYYYRQYNDTKLARNKAIEEMVTKKGLGELGMLSVKIESESERQRAYDEAFEELSKRLKEGLSNSDPVQHRKHVEIYPSTGERNTYSKEEIAERLRVLRGGYHQVSELSGIDIKKKKRAKEPFHDPHWKPIVTGSVSGDLSSFFAPQDNNLKHITYTVTVRDMRQQKIFASQVLDNCNGICLITGFTEIGIIEAAHIDEVRHNGSMKFTNGLMLRADLHRAMDRDLMGINPETLCVFFKIKGYEEFEGSKLCPTKEPLDTQALIKRWQRFNSL